jgi:hypothetical protein
VSLEACPGPQDHTSSHSQGRLALAVFFYFLEYDRATFLASVCLVKFGQGTNYFNFIEEIEDSRHVSAYVIELCRVLLLQLIIEILQFK